MVNFGILAAEIVSLVSGTPANFNGFRVLAAVLHGTLIVGVSQTAAFNRGRHLYSAGRPSGWALAHISSLLVFYLYCICICMYLVNSVRMSHWNKRLLTYSVTVVSPAKNCLTDLDAFWDLDSGWPKDPCIRSGFKSPHAKAKFLGERTWPGTPDDILL